MNGAPSAKIIVTFPLANCEPMQRSLINVDI